MTLREQYETLLRRGMPEHPFVEFREENGWVLWTANRMQLFKVAEEVAYNLLTMHALRWARTRGFDFVLSSNNWQVAELFERDKGDVIGALCYAKSFDDALECIVHETAHLEPKKTLA